MKRFRLIAVTLLAMFALGAVAASAAQAEEAPFWTVGGTRLEKGQTRFITAKEVAPFVLAGGGLTIKCTATEILPYGVLLGSEPGEPGTDDETVTFKTCTVKGNEGKEEKVKGECEKVNEPINTSNLKSELVEDKTKTKLLVLFEPQSGATLAILTFPVSCKLKELKVTGSVLAEVINEKTGKPVELPNPHEQAISWELKFPEIQPVHVWLIKGGTGTEIEAKPLEAGGAAATLSGTALILLAKVENGKLVSTEEEWSPLP
jgi:hypothetical protein